MSDMVFRLGKRKYRVDSDWAEDAAQYIKMYRLFCITMVIYTCCRGVIHLCSSSQPTVSWWVDGMMKR
ncbi:hypothetical protein SAMN05878391_1612 [Salinicoccus kekensis]|uniref:Uncharacterized protein n=2 Tax=Salinicoccus kekensis TaxID=714307 RepID=A0A285UK49_9STAP|nr:hypothetical protein SAMN05878391_1612 [Salinicoccus kekensis]